MKQLFLFALTIILFASCGTTAKTTTASPKYTVINEAGTKVLNGYIDRSLIENDPAFPWFKDNMKYGQADPAAVEVFRNNKDKFKMLVFGGTWCGDTKAMLPVFYRLVDKSGYPDKNITLVGVDHSKKTIDDLHTKWNIVNVPTFIVLHNGKEVGRVVEYGTMGSIDKELAQIISSIK